MVKHPQTNLLENIKSPEDLKQLSIEQLKLLSDEVRWFMTHSVSQTGGHLASNLGVIELTIAMHRVFDFKKDKLLWDVGHQCYAHKILTGRKNQFNKLRQRDGISGFPSPEESEYDQFSVGHAGTSIATALGMALAAQRAKSDEKIVAFVGDASIVNGLSFEALNNLGLAKRQMLIILNDNSMAIDATAGAIAKFLAKVRLSHTYEDLRRTTNRILEHLPLIGKRVEGAIENVKKTLRMAITPSRLFESLNVPYFGPVDGHDIASLIELFETMKDLDTPAVLHVYTKKGKGFSPADDDPRKFHSTGPFKINGEETAAKPAARTFTGAFGDALVELAEKDERIVAITAAMTDGTGLAKFREKFNDRCYDVGIAESAAVDIAAGEAKMGLKPVVCLYSTFLQRCFDQISQEVALQNLGVIFCVDRAGVVGADGPTHHGMMDTGFLRMMPNMTLLAPVNETEVKLALQFALDRDGPVVIRYPKGAVPQEQDQLSSCEKAFEIGKSVAVIETGSDVVIVAYGGIITEALKASEMLKAQNINVDVINARFAKPIDKGIISLLSAGRYIITIEDHRVGCGFGSAVLESANAAGVDCSRVKILGAADEFIKAGTRDVQLDEMGVSAEKIVEEVKKIML